MRVCVLTDRSWPQGKLGEGTESKFIINMKAVPIAREIATTGSGRQSSFKIFKQIPLEEVITSDNTNTSQHSKQSFWKDL